MLERVQYFDDIVLSRIGKLHNPRRNKLMVFVTRLGDKGLVWFAMCVPFLIYKPWRLIGANILVGLVIAHLAGEILIKHLVCRVRPCHKLDDHELVIKRPRYYSVRTYDGVFFCCGRYGAAMLAGCDPGVYSCRSDRFFQAIFARTLFNRRCGRCAARPFVRFFVCRVVPCNVINGQIVKN